MLYRLLPLIYLFWGLLMLANFGDQLFGFVSGSMLCAAAILVWALRAYAGDSSNGRGQ
jgi:hypothetical protein